MGFLILMYCDLLTIGTWGHPTEVGRAPLIHFQKMFSQKGFLQIKISQRTQFYAWNIIEGGKSLKKLEMDQLQQKLNKINLITGAHVDFQKNNHSAMDHIMVQNLNLFHIKQQKLKNCFFVHVNKQMVSLFVMVHTTKSNIEIKILLTTLRL